MQIHNTSEDIVIRCLDEILKNKPDICKCDQCRTDMVCYALNRIKPMYAISSRGVVHFEKQFREEMQDEIDIFSIVNEAVNIISKTTRHEDKSLTDLSKLIPQYKPGTNFFYNFPQIIGRVFDSLTIKPIKDGKITLYHDNKELVLMFNKYWENPFSIVPQIDGTFSFWPAPVPAEKPNIQKDFHFYLEIISDGFQPIWKFFYLRSISTKELKKNIEKTNIYYIPDIYLIPPGDEES